MKDNELTKKLKKIFKKWFGLFLKTKKQKDLLRHQIKIKKPFSKQPIHSRQGFLNSKKLFFFALTNVNIYLISLFLRGTFEKSRVVRAFFKNEKVERFLKAIEKD